MDGVAALCGESWVEVASSSSRIRIVDLDVSDGLEGESITVVCSRFRCSFAVRTSLYALRSEKVFWNDFPVASSEGYE